MWDDPIVQDIRTLREEHAARFNFKIKAIVADLMKQQENSRAKFVSLPPKKTTFLPKIDSKKDAK